MLCSYCKMPRVANEMPCLNCGAPSPVLKTSQDNTMKSAVRHTPDTSRKTPPNFPRESAATASRSQQLNFPDTGYAGNVGQQATHSLLDPPSLIPPWAQLAQPVDPAQTQSTDRQSSLLPVPYQPMPPAGSQPTMTLQLIPDQAVQHLLPAIPVVPDIIQVPPIYTATRPITPKYQAISSLVSVIIVAFLLCGGSVYYAKVSGKLAFLHQIYANTRPPNIQINQTTQFPDPPDKIDTGPAYNTISSAATASRIDPKTKFVIVPQKIFSPGQTFYLAFSVSSPSNDGQVYTKWYTNNQYFSTVQSKERIKAHSNESGSVSITYPQAAEGSVELYWNDQLAQRLYFVVR